MRRRALAALALIAVAPAPAAADHFTSIDLGGVANLDACMAQADQTFQAYARLYGQQASVSSGSWTISGWDLPPLGADITVMCVEVGGVWNAFATGHVAGNGTPPEAMVEQYRDLFTGASGGATK